MTAAEITFNAETAEGAEKNTQEFLGVLCELCVERVFFAL
jgi:hypothetical protein